MRFTKILATLGPASNDARTLRAMLAAGIDGVRLNMSHGTHEEHFKRIRLLRREARKQARPVAVVLDLQGPKIRTAGRFPDGALELRSGDSVVLVGRSIAGSSRRIGLNLRNFARHVRAKERVLIDDGKLRLRVLRKVGDDVHCEIERGGIIRERRGINLPDTQLSLQPLTAKDQRDLVFGMELGIDFVALSFVSSGADVLALRRRLDKLGADARIIAKLERPTALTNLDEILEVTDGVMVARGDLGVEIPLEQVPAAQKHIIARAGEHSRLCITATQMLETMIDKTQPTRAEVSDVANAVFDGTDAVMLSGETAVGRDPAAVVEMMARIVRGAESPPKPVSWTVAPQSRRLFRGVLARAAARASLEIKAKALITLTLSGNTAMRVSKHRPNVPILAVTSSVGAWRRAALYWGVIPTQHRFVENSDLLRASVEKTLIRHRHIAIGDVVAYLGGSHPGGVATDFLQLRRVSGRRDAGTRGALKASGRRG